MKNGNKTVTNVTEISRKSKRAHKSAPPCAGSEVLSVLLILLLILLLVLLLILLILLILLVLLLILLLIILFHVLYPFFHRSGGIALGCCPMIVCHVLPVLLIDKNFF